MKTVEIQCCIARCGHSPFPMAESFYKRARKTHEYWHCPAGHSQHFTGETDEEKLERQVKSLRRQLESSQWNNDALRRQVHRCPWIGCSFIAHPVNDYDVRAMWSHLRQAHGMPTRAEHEASIKEEQSNVR